MMKFLTPALYLILSKHSGLYCKSPISIMLYQRKDGGKGTCLSKSAIAFYVNLATSLILSINYLIPQSPKKEKKNHLPS